MYHFLRLKAIMPRFDPEEKGSPAYLNPDTPENEIASQQAVYQLLSLIVTIIIALVGGAVTGMVMRMIANFERLDEHHRPNQTILKLALSVGNLTGKALGVKGNLFPEEAYFDDHLFFEVHEVFDVVFYLIGLPTSIDYASTNFDFHCF